ncbi:pyridoxal 5'-phosphate synthase glutaminase subunit PdxT [Corynebacterium choanae]|nr:pyridoxal 5'-phosphate synthase glutaminase subunit PdxT [Corynebacterium choanae]
MSSTIGVLALQGGVIEHQRALEACGVDAPLVRRASHLAGLDGLVMPGGESTTMSRLLRIGDLYEPLRDMLHAGLPVFGTCAGMILLAKTVENTRDDAVNFAVIDIDVRRNAFGRQVDSFEAELPVTGIDTPLHTVFIRAPQVTRVGEQVTVLATVTAEDGTERVVAVREGNAMAAAFHPELTADIRMHELFLSHCVHNSAG